MISATEERGVTVRLGPAIRFRGRVVRADGAAEAGAVVDLDVTPWFRSHPGLAMSRTSDAAGAFEFPPIPLAGIDPLNPPQVEATTADQARGFAEADLEQPDAELLVRLQPEWTVRARFLDAEGKPVAAELRAAGPRIWRAKSDAQGRVALRVPPGGRFTFFAVRDTGRFVRCPPPNRGLYLEVWFLAQSLGRREHDARGDVDLGNVVLAPGRPVVGRFVDASGHPAVRARVALLLGDAPFGSVLTDATGQFELPEVSDEPHRLDVRAERSVREDEAGPDASSSRLAAHATVEGVRGGDPELRIVVIDVLTIALRFLAEADRAPVRLTDVRVVVRPHGAPSGTETQCTDTTDRLAVRVPEPGRYDVDVTVGGHEPSRAEDVEVLADRPAALDVVLRRKQE